MTHLDYTWEKREKLIRKEEYEEGVARGISQGMQDLLVTQVRKKLEKGKSIEQIADELEEKEEVICDICRELELR